MDTYYGAECALDFRQMTWLLAQLDEPFDAWNGWGGETPWVYQESEELGIQIAHHVISGGYNITTWVPES